MASPFTATDPREPVGAYSTGLFDCFADGEVLLLGTFVPCYLAATTIGGFRTPGRGVDWFWLCSSLCFGLTPLAAWVARSRVQETFNIREECPSRFACWCFCGSCQLCQDARELRIRQASSIRLEETTSEPIAILSDDGRQALLVDGRSYPAPAHMIRTMPAPQLPSKDKPPAYA